MRERLSFSLLTAVINQLIFNPKSTSYVVITFLTVPKVQENNSYPLPLQQEKAHMTMKHCETLVRNVMRKKTSQL